MNGWMDEWMDQKYLLLVQQNSLYCQIKVAYNTTQNRMSGLMEKPFQDFFFVVPFLEHFFTTSYGLYIIQARIAQLVAHRLENM